MATYKAARVIEYAEGKGAKETIPNGAAFDPKILGGVEAVEKLVKRGIVEKVEDEPAAPAQQQAEPKPAPAPAPAPAPKGNGK